MEGNSFELFDCWVWGGVYYVESIKNPDGEDVGESVSVGEFYGGDHEKSGLVEYCLELCK